MAVVDWLIAETLVGLDATPAAEAAGTAAHHRQQEQLTCRTLSTSTSDADRARGRRVPRAGRALPRPSEVQNIDLMNLAGFCRNCLSKWYRAAAEDHGLELSYEPSARSSTGCLTPTGRPPPDRSQPRTAGLVQGTSLANG